MSNGETTRENYMGKKKQALMFSNVANRLPALAEENKKKHHEE